MLSFRLFCTAGEGVGGNMFFLKIAFSATEISRTEILSRVQHLSCFVFLCSHDSREVVSCY